MNFNTKTKVILGVLGVAGMALASPQVQGFLAGTVAPDVAAHPAISAGLVLVVKALLLIVNPNSPVPQAPAQK